MLDAMQKFRFRNPNRVEKVTSFLRTVIVSKIVKLVHMCVIVLEKSSLKIKESRLQ